MSSTHSESMGDGYYVTVQYCEEEGCNVYLGINYPSDFCSLHKRPSSVIRAVALSSAGLRHILEKETNAYHD